MKSKVIGYQGGGYDGCFWEPNFAYIDGSGKVHDIYSSGRAGLFNKGKQVYQPSELEGLQSYPVTQDGINEMLQDYRQDFVVSVVKVLNADFELELGVKCEKCDAIADPHDIEFESYKGDGGIGIISEGVICRECYDNNRCGKCSEYSSELNEYGVCDSCMWDIEQDIPRIEGLNALMAAGLEQLAEISELNPKYADKYKRQHDKACVEIKAEIKKIIQDEI